MPHLKFNCHLQQKNLCNIIAAWSIWLDVRRLPIRRGEIWLRGVQTRQWNEMSSFCRDGGKQNVNFSIGNSSNIVNANWIRPKKQYFVNIIYWRINQICSVTRFGEILPIWQDIKSLWKNFKHLICMWENYEPTLA